METEQWFIVRQEELEILRKKEVLGKLLEYLKFTRSVRSILTSYISLVDCAGAAIYRVLLELSLECIIQNSNL